MSHKYLYSMYYIILYYEEYKDIGRIPEGRI